MKRILLLLVVFGSTVVLGQEKLTLTTPETHASNTDYHVERLTLDYDAATITISLRGVNGESKSCAYSPATVPTALTLLNGLNKADLSSVYVGNAGTGSLKQRIFHRLVVMNEAATVCGGALVGTVAGSVP